MEDLNVHPFILYFCLHPKLKTKLAIYFIYVYYRILSSGKLSLFLRFDKEWQFKSLFEHEPLVELTQNDKFHLCKWPSKDRHVK